MRRLALARAAEALALLGYARVHARRGDAAAARVATALSVRGLAQTAVIARRPDAMRLRIGAAVDALHALSMLALGGVDAGRRGAALCSAGGAGAFALWQQRIAARATPLSSTPRPRRRPGRR